MQLVRPTCLLLLADGSTIGGFHVAADTASKKSSMGLTACVVLEPNGHCYSYLSSQTISTPLSVQRFTCASAPSAHIPLLRLALDFRNKHALDRPLYLHQHHLLSSALQWHAGETRPVDAISVRWRCGTFHISRMDCPDGLRIQSLDGMASVTLMNRSTHFFRASFVAPVDYHASVEHMTAGRALFTRVHQCFTRHNAPAAFQYPVQVLGAAMDAATEGRRSFAVHATNSLSSDSYITTHLPTNGAFAARPNWTHFRPSGAPQLSPGDVYSYCKRRRAGASGGFPTAVRVEWTPTATFMAIPSHAVVCVHVHTDDSSIECTRTGYFHHRRGDQDHCYTVDAVPPRPPFRRLQDAPAADYDVGDICLRARRLCDVMTTDEAARESETPPSAPHAIVEEQETEMGVFRAFGDGRVRVVFADRAILSMDPDARFFSLFLPSGDTVTLSASSPSPQFMRYVVAAQSFQLWAFQTPVERAAYVSRLQQQHDLVDDELRRTRRFVRESANGIKVDYSDASARHTHQRGRIQYVLQATADHIQRVGAALRSNEQAIFGGVK